jgi:hypothetical protein
MVGGGSIERWKRRGMKGDGVGDGCEDGKGRRGSGREEEGGGEERGE